MGFSPDRHYGDRRSPKFHFYFIGRLQEAETTARTQREAQEAAMQAVAVELGEIRKFAMRSIDDVRGETRTERERRVQLEELLKKNERLMETFRQIAYQRGGQIPAELRMESAR